MKLEVGMYVRFKTLSNEVKIGQIQLIDNNIYELDNNEVTSDKYIIKASHTLLGNNEEPCLIEIEDYVNGSKVIDISIIGKDKEKWVWVEQMEDTDNKYGDDYVGYNNEQIKSIVTKEQFSSMEYRLGGKNE